MNNNILEFLNDSPTAFGGISSIVKMLTSKGYKPLGSKIEKGKKSILARSECPKDEVCLSVVANGLDLQFYVGESEKSLQKFGDVQDATIISTNKAGGFIGPMIGMYCSSNGVQSSNKAVYEYFEYQPTM